MKQMQKSNIPFNKTTIYGLTVAALTAMSSGAFAATITGTQLDPNLNTDKTCFFHADSATVICGDQTTTVEDRYDSKPAKGVVLGIGAKATGESNVALGAKSSASSTSGIAIGHESKAHHNQTVGIGHMAEALGEADVMIGKLAGNGNTSNGRNIGIGESALKNATSNNVIAIGTSAGLGMNGTHTVIVGTEANTAVGNRTAVTTNYNTAVGYRSYASGGSAFAGGHSAEATGSQAVAIGFGSVGGNSYTVAVGRNSQASGVNGVAIGNASSATGTSAVSVGLLSQATGRDSVAIGTNANYQAAADGNPAQAKSVGQNSVTIGTNANGANIGAVAIGGTTQNAEGTTASGQYSIAVGTNAQTTGNSGLALGQGSRADQNFGVALGALSTTKNTQIQDGYAPAKISTEAQQSIANTKANTAGVSLGGDVSEAANKPTTLGSDTVMRRQIHHLAAGTNDTDAVNVAQLKALEDSFSQQGLTFTGDTGTTTQKLGSSLKVAGDENIVTEATENNIQLKLNKNINLTADGSVQAGNTKLAADGLTIQNANGNPDNTVSVSSAGLNNGGQRVTNMADGVADTDGVTVGQLNNMQTNINNSINAAKSTVVNGNNIVVTATPNGANGTQYTVATSPEVTFDKVTVPSQAGTGKETIIGNTGIQMGDVKLSHDTVNVGGNKITNVKAGEISAASTDAVNGSQLHALNLSVNNNATNIQQNADKIAKGLTFTGDTGSANTQLGDTFKLAGSKNITTSVDAATKTATVKLNDTVDVKAVNSDVYNVNGSSVQLGATGLNNGGNTITNVADGINNSDAVNLGQLNRALQNMPTTADVAGLNGRVNGLNQAVGKIGSRINEVEQEGRAGVAMSMATAGLGQVYVPGRSAISVGTGFYRGEQGYAIGLSTISDGGNWILKGSVSGNSRGHVGGTTSVTYMF